MRDRLLLTETQLVDACKDYKTVNIAEAEIISFAQLCKTLELLDELNTIVPHTSPNYPNHCGLEITIEKWQALRKFVALGADRWNIQKKSKG